MDKKIIVANWKMRPDTLQEAEDLFRLSRGAIVCPPFVYIEALSKLTEAVLGAQDCHFEDEGAFTGEVSAKMLKNLGVKYVIIGHSERRWIMGETDEMINKKLKAVLRNEMTPILAVGERARRDDYREVIIDQLEKALERVDQKDIKNIIFAYEPVWAIGTGHVATPRQAQDAHHFIRQRLTATYGLDVAQAVHIQYGGSVKPDNAAALLHQPDVDGALVGGASLQPESFLGIIKAAF